MTHSRSRAQIYLEKIQRDFYKERNLWLNEYKTRREQHWERLRKNPFSIYLEEDLSKLSPEQLDFYRNKMEADLQKKIVEAPTEYEDPMTYNIIMELARDIKSVLPKKIADVGIQFGTLPIGPTDALHIAVPDSTEHLIIFESELFYFCNMISKVVATACPINEITYRRAPDGTKRRWISTLCDLRDVENNLNKNRTILKHFREIILAYLIHGSVNKAPGYIVPEEYFRPYIIFRLGMELFAMGHEYGHVALGHLNADQYIDRQIASHKVKEIQRTGLLETMADAAGVKYMVEAMFKIYAIDISASYASAELFFQSLRILQLAAEITKKEHPTYGSHPSLKYRRDVLRETMKKLCESGGIDAHLALDYASKIENVVWFLWKKIEPDLYGWYKMHTEMIPFENIWRWI